MRPGVSIGDGLPPLRTTEFSSLQCFQILSPSFRRASLGRAELMPISRHHTGLGFLVGVEVAVSRRPSTQPCQLSNDLSW